MVQSKSGKRHKYATWEYKWYKAKLSGRMMGYIKIDKKCGVSIYKVDKENKNEQEGRK